MTQHEDDREFAVRFFAGEQAQPPRTEAAQPTKDQAEAHALARSLFAQPDTTPTTKES